MALQNYIKGISIEELKEVLETYEYEYSLNVYSNLFVIETDISKIELFKEDLDSLVNIINGDYMYNNNGLSEITYYNGVLTIITKDYMGDIMDSIYMNDKQKIILLNYINKYYKQVISEEEF
jgi:hypothetical protein